MRSGIECVLFAADVLGKRHEAVVGMKPCNVHEHGRVRFRHFIQDFGYQADLLGVIHFAETRRHVPFKRKLPQDGRAQ